ncbi:MAG TPA: exodeoxyribonuclease VII small subunit [Chloroflexota bacterium]|nr:exodeoxyribonuclease VII small subunit [Chloroflexota bacterium]
MNSEDTALERLSFEDAFGRLQSAIQALEEGGLTLEASIEQFEIGMRLANYCATLLDQAELKVSRLLGNGQDDAETVPLSPDNLRSN